MTLYFSGSPIANVVLTDTFNTWRTRFNQSIDDGTSRTANNTFNGSLITVTNDLTVRGTLNATGLVDIDGDATVDQLTANTLGGTLSTAAQPNVTSVGSLTSLTSGQITGTSGAGFAGPVTAPVVTANTVGGTLSTAAQPNITSVGTLTSLTSSGTVQGATVTATGQVNGATLNITGNATVDGDLTVAGNVETINSTNLSLSDNMIYLNANNTVTNPDLGWAGNYNDGVYAHAGLFRDASDQGTFKFFHEYTPEPDASPEINTGHGSFQLANVSMAWVKPTSGISTIKGTYTGLVSAPTFNANNIGGTLTTAAQGNITSVGTLTGLTVSGLSTFGSGGAGAALFSSYLKEKVTVSASAATGTINYNVKDATVVYYTTNASGNWTLNIRGDASTSLDSIMSTGESLTLVFLATQGGTGYYQTTFQIDGSSVTPEWQGGSAPSAGNASSIDVYAFSIIKTGSATFKVLGSQTQFA